MYIRKCMNISAIWRTTLLGPQIPQTASKKGKIHGGGFGLEDLGGGITGMSRRTNLARGDVEKKGGP